MTPTPASQWRDRQRHLRALQPAQGAITGANAKTIFIQANGSLERDYWCRRKSCTPDSALAQPTAMAFLWFADSIGSLCFGEQWLAPFLVTMPWIPETRVWRGQVFLHTYLVKALFHSIAAVTSLIKVWPEAKPGSLIQVSIIHEIRPLFAPCCRQLTSFHDSRLFSPCVNGVSKLCLLCVCV